MNAALRVLQTSAFASIAEVAVAAINQPQPTLWLVGPQDEVQALELASTFDEVARADISTESLVVRLARLAHRRQLRLSSASSS